MFYFILFIKLFLFFIIPIISTFLIKRRNKKYNKLIIFSYSLWLIFVGYLTYVPFIFWYIRNEVNVQSLFPVYGVFGIIFIYLVLPSVYLYLIAKPNIKKISRIIVNFIGMLWLTLSIGILAAIELYNHKNTEDLNNICYQMHSSSDEKLACCLKAEYVWNEGLSFFETPSEQCVKYMNWND